MAEASIPAGSIELQIQSRLAKNAANYNEWIYSRIAPYLGRRVLDVGCAIGNITQFYIDVDLVVGIDVVPDELEVARKRFAGHNFEAHHMDVSSDQLPRFRERGLDTAVCLNVLEHLEDDVHALRNIRDTLRPSARICLLVPVNKWLYGPMDAVDHHYRRYTKTELNAKLAEANLTIEHQTYFNMLGILAWALNNKLLRRRMAADGQYRLFDRLVPLLKAIENRFPPPAGLSLVTVCRTPAA